MPLETLSIAGFRNIESAHLVFAPGLNVIFGDNAAGKTSLLEAMHCLARARSFLPVSLDRLIRQGDSRLLLSGKIATASGKHRVGLSRSAAKTQVRLDGHDATSLSEVAWLLPLQVLNTQSQRLLTDGPTERRAFLNWGAFHVEHRYRDFWRRYDRAHRQRNVALKNGDSRLARAWEGELAEAGSAVDGERRAFLEALRPLWREQVIRWLPGIDIDWSYRRGWARDTALADALKRERDQAMRLGYGLSGPHRADVRFLAVGADAASWLSRGQQKLVVVALRLAVLRLLVAQGTAITPCLLIDDLPAELDETNRLDVLRQSTSLGAQVFVTCIERDSLSARIDIPTKWFHVEPGRYVEVI